MIPATTAQIKAFKIAINNQVFTFIAGFVANDRVITNAAVDDITTGAALDYVIAILTKDCIRTGTTVDIIARTYLSKRVL